MIGRPALWRPLVRELGRDLLGSRRTHAIDQAITNLFANGEEGVWLDTGDPSAMYQNSVGSSPVTGADQPVGLWLDRRLGLVRGGELVANGDFASGTGWMLGTGWTVSEGRAVHAGGVAGDLQQNVLTSGRWYEALFERADSSGDSINVRLGSNYVNAGGAAGARRVIGLASGVQLSLQGSGSYLVDNVSVRELAGNHVAQATTTSRPVFKQGAGERPYLHFTLDDSLSSASGGGGTSGFFLCAAIRVEGETGAAQEIWSDETNNAGHIVRVADNGALHMAVGDGAEYTDVSTDEVLSVGETHVVAAWDDGTNLNVQIDNGPIASVDRPESIAAGTADFTIGKQNGTAARFFNGRVYRLVQRFGTSVSDAERERVKREVARAAGVTL